VTVALSLPDWKALFTLKRNPASADIAYRYSKHREFEYIAERAHMGKKISGGVSQRLATWPQGSVRCSRPDDTNELLLLMSSL
jgi:hypothetical protein